MNKLIELSAEQIVALKSASLMSPETSARQCHFIKPPKPGKSWAQCISSKTNEKIVVNMADCLEEANMAASTGKNIPGFVKENGLYALTSDFEFDIVSGNIIPLGKVEPDLTPEEKALLEKMTAKQK